MSATAYRAPAGYEPPDFDEFFVDGRFDNDKYHKTNADYIDRLAARARQNGSSELLGEVLSWPVADGAAQYMVWNTRPLELIHLELGDAYQVDPIMLRGLRLSDVREMVERERRIRALFTERRSGNGAA